jgi:hypothetical protein
MTHRGGQTAYKADRNSEAWTRSLKPKTMRQNLDRSWALLFGRVIFTVPPKMAFFDCVGICLMLAIPERPDLDHPSSILYFKVPDIESAHKVFAVARCAFRDQTDARRADGDP